MPVPQSAAAHTYPTQPIPVGDELVPHVPSDPQDYQGILAPDGKPYVFSTVPYTPYTDQQYVVMAPPASGGVEWPIAAWDPVRGVEVVCANVCSRRARVAACGRPAPGDQQRRPDHPVADVVGARTR